MPSNSKSKKKKSKSKNNNNKKNNLTSHAEVFDENEEYPTSRVIKRGPNGDVIVESMTPSTTADKKKKKSKKTEPNGNKNAPQLATVLDLHWESLSPEDKKDILRIDKVDVFNIIQKYQADHSCNCSVCGKRHMAMDQEMERIYNMLYEIDKIKDPEINPIKFHLGIIKDLQISKNDSMSPPQHTVIPKKLISQDEDDEELKEFLTSNDATALKEEVLHFKQAKKLEHQEHLNNNHNQDSLFTANNDIYEGNDDNDEPPVQRSPPPPPPPPVFEDDISTRTPQHHLRSQRIEQINPESSYIEDKLLKGKYMQFTQKYISSHPKIAEEYVKRVMMYPEMRFVTDQLMANDGDGFLKAIEKFVIERARDENGNIDEGYYQKLGDVRSFTTMLHKGQPLTTQEYADLQRNIAERMTGSYDTKRKEFREISPLEKELFARFMFGEDREQFGEMVMQSFREKFDHEFGGASISASLAAAAAAATLTNPLNISSNNQHQIQEEKEEYEDSYDYSDYDDDSDFLSEYSNEDEEEDNLSRYGEETDSEHECVDPNHEHSTTQVFTHNREHIDADDEDHYFHDDDSQHMSHDEDYESEIDEATRLEEGRKLIQIAITKLLQGRILESYHTKQADVNRLKLLQELEDEKQKKKAKEEKKQRKKEKEKEKKKLQQQAKEAEKRKKSEEEERLRKESEQREKERREAQRKKVEEAKKKKDEERRRRLEEQRKREEQQEKQRKLKEEMKKKKEEERKQKEREQKEAEQKRKEKEMEEQRIVRETKERKEKELQEQARIEKQEQENQASKSKTLQKSDADEIIKQTLAPVDDKTGDTNNSNIFSGSIPNSNNLPAQIPSFGSESLLGNALGRNINSTSSNADILNLLGSSSVSTPAGFNNPNTNNSSLLNSNVSIQQQNILPTSHPVTSSMANGLLPSSLWNGVSAPHSSSSMFDNSALTHQNKLLMSLNNSAFGSSQQMGAPHSQPHNVSQNLNDELNSLTSMLKSSNINDPLFTGNNNVVGVGNGNAFNSTSLWSDTQLRPNTTNGTPTTANNGGVSLLSVDNTLGSVPQGSNSLSFTDHGLQHRKSIWNDSIAPANSFGVPTTPNNIPMPMKDGSMTGIPLSSMDNSYSLNNDIWNTGYGNNNVNNTNTSPLDNTVHNGIATPINNVNPATSVLNAASTPSSSLNDHAIFDLICKAYANVIHTQPSNHSFVPIDTLYHQFSTTMQMDYHGFINKLLEMRILHGCEILNSSMGTISHVKIKLDNTISRIAIPPGINGSTSTINNDPSEGDIGMTNKNQMAASMLLNAVGSNSSA